MTPAPNSKRGLAPRLRVLVEDPRRAIQERWIVCLVCGGVFRQLTNTHLQSHGTTAAEYRQRFGYNLRRPLMCRALLRVYRERALRFGLAARIRHRPIVSNPELRRRGSRRPVTIEELLNRREVRLVRAASGSSGARRGIA
jgi:hypothetical protein